MKTAKNELTNQVTKKAWEKNWEDIRMEEILEIFSYERVKKQMEIFLRVLPKGRGRRSSDAGIPSVGVEEDEG
jgi:hypothetical protein